VKVTAEELERCETLLTIEFDPNKEQDLLKKAAKRIAREVNIPGFRRGKAPFNTIVRRFGIEAVQQEALETMGDKVIKDALDEADIEPFAQIQLAEVNWEPLVIKLKVPTGPKIELGNYRDLRLDFEPVDVTDEDVEETLTSLQEQNATWSPVERPAELGDLISMTVTEKDGDKVLVDNESVEFEITEPDEEDSKRPDLTTPLLGLSAGESKTFTVTYPDEFDNEEYAGKEITVSVDVSGVKVKELDPLDDDFAQQVSDFKTLEELTENIRANLLKQRERERDNELGTKMVEKIIEDAKLIEWPQAVEEEEIDEEIERTERRLKDVGFTLDGYLQMQQKTEEAWREELRESVVARLKRGLVLSEVAELEGLEVSHSEILEQAKLIADYSGGGEQLWRNILSSRAQQNLIATDVMSSKAVERLAAIARGEAPEPGAKEEAETVEPEAAEEPAPADDAAEEVTSDETSPEPSEAEEEAREEAEEKA
jgi:trigger factor